MELPSWIVVFAVPAAIFLFLKLLANQQTKKDAEEHSAITKSKENKEEQ
ncbi:MAG: hypothetical protein WAX66_03670 [Patescibacteria group bacterium]